MSEWAAVKRAVLATTIETVFASPVALASIVTIASKADEGADRTRRLVLVYAKERENGYLGDKYVAEIPSGVGTIDPDLKFPATIALTDRRLEIADALISSELGKDRRAVDSGGIAPAFCIAQAPTAAVDELAIQIGSVSGGGGVFAKSGANLSLASCTVSVSRA